MTNFSCRHLIVFPAVLLSVSFPQAVFAAGKIFPIQEFEGVKDNWIGLETTVEGRKTVYDPSLIKLKNSTITFKPQETLPRLDRRTQNIRVTGSLQKMDGRLVFLVKSVEAAPSDLEQYQRRERDIKKSSPSDWYNLADWVEQRGRFYDDLTLIDRARECRRRGFDIERQKLPDKDHVARMELASRANGLGIPDTERQELVHEAYILRRKAILEQPEQQAEDQLMSDMEQDLPGCKKTLAADDPTLRQRYLTNPDGVYANTKPADRPTLHRILWSSLELIRLERQLAPDFQNGYEIASKIDQELPEFHSRAETYREKMLQVRASNVENMTRAEVLKLREDYRQRQQPKLGEEAVESWLQWKKKRLKSDDVEGYINLADQYEELLHQPESRLRLLIETARNHPDTPELVERLTKAGYRLHDGRWITESEFKSVPTGRLEQAMREGRIELGMTAAQLHKSQGAPTSLTRVTATGIINEIWIYQNPGNSQPLTVYLSRRLPATESTVVGIDKLP